MRRDLAVARGVSSQTDNVVTSVILQVDIPRRQYIEVAAIVTTAAIATTVIVNATVRRLLRFSS